MLRYWLMATHLATCDRHRSLCSPQCTGCSEGLMFVFTHLCQPASSSGICRAERNPLFIRKPRERNTDRIYEPACLGAGMVLFLSTHPVLRTSNAGAEPPARVARPTDCQAATQESHLPTPRTLPENPKERRRVEPHVNTALRPSPSLAPFPPCVWDISEAPCPYRAWGWDGLPLLLPT